MNKDVNRFAKIISLILQFLKTVKYYKTYFTIPLLNLTNRQIAEFLGGYLSGSLAIMTDAAHLLSDCISFLIAVISIWISNKPPDGKMSFGYRRVGNVRLFRLATKIGRF